MSLEQTSDGITYRDCNGKPIALGDKVLDFHGPAGEIVGFSAPDENWGGVYVKWPEFDEPEFQRASYGVFDEVHTCQEIEIASKDGE